MSIVAVHISPLTNIANSSPFRVFSDWKIAILMNVERKEEDGYVVEYHLDRLSKFSSFIFREFLVYDSSFRQLFHAPILAVRKFLEAERRRC